MNILYYIPHLNKNAGGIYQYALGMLSVLSKDTEHTYFVYHGEQNAELDEIAKRSEAIKIIDPKESTHQTVGYKWGRSMQLLKQKIGFALPYTLPYHKSIQKYKIDLVHCPYQFLPECSVPTMSTLHDVQDLHFPEFFSEEVRNERKKNFQSIVDNAEGIVVSYDHIKKDIETYYKRSKDVFVCLLDMEKLWFDSLVDSEPISLNHFNLPETFLLYPAATWQHKNHLILIKAVAKLKESGTFVHIACTGKKNDFYETDVLPALEKYNVKDNFSFFGIVSDEKLYSLYKHTHATVIPTLYEAGSFVLYESIILGVPTVCSNVTSLPETIDNDAFVFDPHNVEDVMDKITRISTDEEYRQMNLKNSLVRKDALKYNNALTTCKKIYTELKNT